MINLYVKHQQIVLHILNRHKLDIHLQNHAVVFHKLLVQEHHNHVQEGKSAQQFHLQLLSIQQLKPTTQNFNVQHQMYATHI